MRRGVGDFLSSRSLWYSNLMCRIFCCCQAFYYIVLHAIVFSDKSFEGFFIFKSLTPSQELNCQPLWKCNNENRWKIMLMVYEEGCYVLGLLTISNHFGSFSFTIPIAMTTVNIKHLTTGPEGNSEFVSLESQCFPRRSRGKHWDSRETKFTLPQGTSH